MIKKINKRGSHVGVVVSFVIFVTFLVFLYTIIQPPTARERDKSYVLDYITLNLMGNVSGEISTLIIYVGEPIHPLKSCFIIPEIDIQQIPEELRYHMVFKNESGHILDYRIKNIETIYIQSNAGYRGIINVQAIEGITPQLNDDLKTCDDTPYPMGNLKVYSEIFEEKMYELNESYDADYEVLKAYLGIPEGAEFNFYVYNSEWQIIISAEEYEPPTDRSVFVEETPIQYADEKGNILFGFLVVKVW